MSHEQISRHWDDKSTKYVNVTRNTNLREHLVEDLDLRRRVGDSESQIFDMGREVGLSSFVSALSKIPRD